MYLFVTPTSFFGEISVQFCPFFSNLNICSHMPDIVLHIEDEEA